MNISRLAAAIREDVNREDSTIIDSFAMILNGLFKIILFCGVPYIAYLLYLLVQQS